MPKMLRRTAASGRLGHVLLLLLLAASALVVSARVRSNKWTRKPPPCQLVAVRSPAHTYIHTYIHPAALATARFLHHLSTGALMHGEYPGAHPVRRRGL